jgi:hypothetical protein
MAAPDEQALEDVNTKLADLGLPTVAAAAVAGSVAALPAGGPAIQVMRRMHAELQLPGATTAAPSAFMAAVVGLGLNHVHGPTPSPLQVLDFLASEVQTRRLSNFNAAAGAPAAGAAAAGAAGIGSAAAATSTTGPEAAALSPTASPESAVVASMLGKLAACMGRAGDATKLAAGGAALVAFLHQLQAHTRTLQTNAGAALFDRAALVSRRDLLDRINAALRNDYRLRRQMLLQRADITIQSFLWTDHVSEAKLSVVRSEALGGRAYGAAAQAAVGTAAKRLLGVATITQDDVEQIITTSHPSLVFVVVELCRTAALYSRPRPLRNACGQRWSLNPL